MCQLCAIASRYQRAPKPDSLLLNTDQLSSLIKQLSQASEKTVSAFKSAEQNDDTSNSG